VARAKTLGAVLVEVAMSRTHDEPTTDLAGWEKLPAWALGISQGLNIFLWYIMSLERVALQGQSAIRVPEFVITFLPLAVFVAAIAAAVSLDGTMIATIGGSRNGRDGIWTWVSVTAAALFSAGIALDVYGGAVLPGAWLHIAQTAVLFCYMMHLRQKRKALTPIGGADPVLNLAEPKSTAELATIAAARPSADDLTEYGTYPAPVLSLQPKLRACRYCGETLPISTLGAHGRNFKRFGSCVKL